MERERGWARGEMGERGERGKPEKEKRGHTEFCFSLTCCSGSQLDGTAVTT